MNHQRKFGSKEMGELRGQPWEFFANYAETSHN